MHMNKIYMGLNLVDLQSKIMSFPGHLFIVLRVKTTN